MNILKRFGTGNKPIEKKGEINDLKDALSDPNIEKDQEKKRELLQRVIAYVTMGVDTSKLFENMILVFFNFFKILL
jgi:hypothetical protein